MYTNDSAALSFNDTFARLVPVSKKLRDAEFDEVTQIIERSRELLEPLGEPHEHNIGLNRWLARTREEEYSNWLKWLFEQITAGELMKILSLEQQLGLQDDKDLGESVSVVREYWVPEGHDGQSGRIDLTLKLGDWALVTVEVKKDDADTSDTKKQLGYRKSIEREFRHVRKMAFVLLAATSSKRVVHGFTFHSYEAFSRNLRRLAIAWMKGQHFSLYKAAMTLTLAATIESNLLHLSVQKSSFTPETLTYFNEFLGKTDYE